MRGLLRYLDDGRSIAQPGKRQWLYLETSTRTVLDTNQAYWMMKGVMPPRVVTHIYHRLLATFVTLQPLSLARRVAEMI
jgi:hypothetical protein